MSTLPGGTVFRVKSGAIHYVVPWSPECPIPRNGILAWGSGSTPSVEEVVILWSPVAQDTTDPVKRPAHYVRLKPEPIDVINSWGLAYNLGNVIKYVARAGHKDGAKRIDDLEKARNYLDIELRKLGAGK